MKQKVALLAVMQLAARRPAAERSIPFAVVAAATRLPLDQVEWLLMRAMSLELLRGVIDDVDAVVHVSWIRVRCRRRARARRRPV